MRDTWSIHFYCQLNVVKALSVQSELTHPLDIKHNSLNRLFQGSRLLNFFPASEFPTNSRSAVHSLNTGEPKSGEDKVKNPALPWVFPHGSRRGGEGSNDWYIETLLLGSY